MDWEAAERCCCTRSIDFWHVWFRLVFYNPFICLLWRGILRNTSDFLCQLGLTLRISGLRVAVVQVKMCASAELTTVIHSPFQPAPVKAHPPKRAWTAWLLTRPTLQVQRMCPVANDSLGGLASACGISQGLGADFRFLWNYVLFMNEVFHWKAIEILQLAQWWAPASLCSEVTPAYWAVNTEVGRGK